MLALVQHSELPASAAQHRSAGLKELTPSAQRFQSNQECFGLLLTLLNGNFNMNFKHYKSEAWPKKNWFCREWE